MEINEIMIECARTEITEKIVEICEKNGLPLEIMDGILSMVLADIRQQEKTRIVKETIALLQQKNKELEKAKKEAKKILKEEQEEEDNNTI